MDVTHVMVWSDLPDEGSAGTLSGGGICYIENIVAIGSKCLINGALGARDAIAISITALLMNGGSAHIPCFSENMIPRPMKSHKSSQGMRKTWVTLRDNWFTNKSF
jgi:hypothetical protein